MALPLPFTGRLSWRLSGSRRSQARRQPSRSRPPGCCAHLEFIDAARDARALQASFSVDPSAALARLQQGLPTPEVGREHGTAGVMVDEVVPLALLAQIAFFASGHQAILMSLQWKAAFVLTSKVSYPLSPLFVILNTFGPT